MMVHSSFPCTFSQIKSLLSLVSNFLKMGLNSCPIHWICLNLQTVQFPVLILCNFQNNYISFIRILKLLRQINWISQKASDLYLGSSGFEFWPQYRLSWFWFLWFLSVLPGEDGDIAPKSATYFLLSYPFQFIIHRPSCHLTIRNHEAALYDSLLTFRNLASYI